MYIYTPLCRYWIVLYRYVLVFIVPHVDIELEDNKQFISNIPRTIIIHYYTLLYFTYLIMPLPFSVGGGGGGGGGGAYSITAVRTYVHPSRPVRNTFGFHAISFERIGILDWNFIHRYIIIKYRSSSI